MEVFHGEGAELLVRAVLTLETPEECRAFLEDLMTGKEIQDCSQRILVARMLQEKQVYNTIAAATDLAKNTVMKGISTLSELNLITVEASSYFDKRGMKWKGNNLYTILPVRPAVDTFHQRQLRQLELDVERRRVIRRQQEYDRRHPRAALCTPAVAEAALDPAQSQEALCAR